MRKLALALSLVLFFCLSGCYFSVPVEKSTYFAMDTVITAEIHDQEAKELNKKIFDLVNEMASVLDAENIPTDKISPENKHIYQLLGASLALSKLTGGTFDVTIGGIINAWGFDDKNYRVPTAQELEQLRAAAGFERVEGTEQGYFLPEGCRINFGAIAKGYISDYIFSELQLGLADGAIISLGGNVIAYGSNKGNPWKIGIESPSGDGSVVGVMQLTDCFAVTSGGYHRNFTQDGITYHHIIDPATGYPAENDLLSVTIVSKSGVWCDAFSTALFVMGSEKAIQFWKNFEYDFDFVLITKSGEIIVSAPLSEEITDIDSAYTLRVAEK
ncbi:MAG: FAD:protein FMN transferase [Clostridia bacterium]|nr:FAD:protein FMN transferase [Clostridia bacterium]